MVSTVQKKDAIFDMSFYRETKTKLFEQQLADSAKRNIPGTEVGPV